jgi:hypothetical protein
MSYDSKCKVPQDYINLAMEQLQDDQTFSAKAHQKEAMTYLNRAYEMVRGQNNLKAHANCVGINHLTCTRSVTVTLLCSRKSITPP